MSTSVENVSKAYVKAWQEKDLQALGDLIDPAIVFKSPTATTNGRDAYLAAAKRFISLVERIDVRARCVTESDAMVAYDFVCREPIGVSATAELITVKNSLVAYSEVFFDARPFAALAKLPAPASTQK